MRLLSKKPLFARLNEDDLRALVLIWIEALLAESAFDAHIAPLDRKHVVPGEGLPLTTTTLHTQKWNEAEKAAETVLGYRKDELAALRQALVDELCETKQGVAFLRPEKLALRLTLDDSWYLCQNCCQLTWLPLRHRCPNPHCGSSQLIQLPGDDPNLRARTDFYRGPLRQVLSEQHIPMHITAEEHTAQLSHRDTQHVSATTEQYELRFQDVGISPQQPAIDILSCTTTMEVGVDIGALPAIGLRTMPPRRANYQQRAGRAGRRNAALATVLTYSENGTHDAHYFAHPDEMIAGTLPTPHISPLNERLARRHIQAALIQTFFLEHIETPVRTSERQYSSLSEALGTAQAFFTTATPYSLKAFAQWLHSTLQSSRPLLAQRIAAWLPATLAETPMDEQQKLAFVRTVAKEYVEKLYTVGEQLSFIRAKTTIEESTNAFPMDEILLLDLLFEQGFLPTYAFPREVRSFVIEEWKHENSGKWRIGIKQRPQQSVDIALAEYAPGRELIIDKETYHVGGIYVDPFSGVTLANRVSSFFVHQHLTFSFCSNCGYTHREDTSTTKERHTFCPLCHSQLQLQEIVDPPNFAPERAKPVEPGSPHSPSTRSTSTATSVKLTLPLTDTEMFEGKAAHGRVAWSSAEHRELLITNSRVNGEGFSICRSCGAAAPGKPSWLQQAHDRPFLVPAWLTASRKCTSPDGVWHGYVGHCFHSDLLLLRFHWPARVAYDVGQRWMHDALDTLAQALLLAATRLLDVASSELQVGWSHTIAASQTKQDTLPRMTDFFLFDTLAGGAGYATQIGQYMDTLLHQTQHVLDTCPEECERSCYRCLRTYHNRVQHQYLDRHLAGTLLRALLTGQPPATASVTQQAAQLEMLSRFLELAGGIASEREVSLHGQTIPLLLKTSHGNYAIGTYPVQQDHKAVSHALETLSRPYVRLFSDYDLAHNLPAIAQLLL